MDSMTGVLGRPVAVAEVLTPLLRHLATVLDRCWAEEEQGDRRSPLRKT
jgi:hypothetical protein